MREGQQPVEAFAELLPCALMSCGVNRYKRPAKASAVKEKKRQDEREAYQQSPKLQSWPVFFHRLQEEQKTEKADRFPRRSGGEHILYFCDKYAPDLPEWKREIIRIVRKVSQKCFYPQGSTKVMNEGCATYTHYSDHESPARQGVDDRRGDAGVPQFAYQRGHAAGVRRQSPLNGVQIYALGFAMMRDVEKKRICKDPTAEDRKRFGPAGCNDEMTVLKDAWSELS